MVIQHNMTSINAKCQLGINTENKKKSTERLSGGYRINRAADDTAGSKCIIMSFNDANMAEEMVGYAKGSQCWHNQER